MKRLGDIIHVMDNLLIVRADRMPEHGVFSENMVVVSRKMKKIGKVREIFGPVNAPYVSVRMFNNMDPSEVKGLKNERVYLQ